MEGEASVPAEVEDWMPPSLATTAVENNNTPVVVQSRTIVDGWEDLPSGRYDTSEGTTSDTSSVRPSVGRCNLMDPSFARGSDMAPDEEVRRLLALSMPRSNRTSARQSRACVVARHVAHEPRGGEPDHRPSHRNRLAVTNRGRPRGGPPGLGRPRTPLGWVQTSTPSVRLKDRRPTEGT